MFRYSFPAVYTWVLACAHVCSPWSPPSHVVHTPADPGPEIAAPSLQLSHNNWNVLPFHQQQRVDMNESEDFVHTRNFRRLLSFNKFSQQISGGLTKKCVRKVNFLKNSFFSRSEWSWLLFTTTLHKWTLWNSFPLHGNYFWLMKEGGFAWVSPFLRKRQKSESVSPALLKTKIILT